MKKMKIEQNQFILALKKVMNLQISPIRQKEPTIIQKKVLTKIKSLKRPRILNLLIIQKQRRKRILEKGN